MKNFIPLLAAISLVGCFPEESTDTNANSSNGSQSSLPAEKTALFVTTVSADYTTSDVAVVSKNETGAFVVIEDQLEATSPSDIQLSLIGDKAYRLDRSNSDSITALSWNYDEMSLEADWQYSILGSESSANPYALASADGRFAYVARYNSDVLWKVDLQATRSEDFKVSEIDLSQFNTFSDGSLNMADAKIIGNRLFVLLQNLEGFSPSAVSQIAVINTDTNELVDANEATEQLDAIELNIRNANNLSIFGFELYVSGAGDVWGGTGDAANKYTGGIDVVDSRDLTVEQLLNDGDSNSAPYGNIGRVHMADNGTLYFIGIQGYGDNEVYVKKPFSTDINPLFGSLATKTYNISDIATSGDDLYVSVFAQADLSEGASIKVFNTQTYQQTETILLKKNPTSINVR